MSKFKFIKSEQQMMFELFTLWDNKNLYTFLQGEDYVRQKEREITKQLTNNKREMRSYKSFAKRHENSH